MQAEIQLPVSQALALFAKVIRKIANALQDIQKAQISAEMALPKATPSEQREEDQEPQPAGTNSVPGDEGDKATEEQRDDRDTALREKQREMIQSLDLSKYAIDKRDVDWSVAEAQVSKLAATGGTSGKSTLISVKSAVASSNVGAKRKVPEDVVEGHGGNDKKKTRRGGGGKKAKR